MSNLAVLAEIDSLFACPRCSSSLSRAENRYFCTNLDCVYSQDRHFDFAGSWPVLVDFDRSILDEKTVFATRGESLLPRQPSNGVLRRALRDLVYPSQEKIATKVTARLVELTMKIAPKPTVLVVGGGTMGVGLQALYDNPSIRVIGFDIYGSSLTQFIADAHQIPLQNHCVDAVIVQSVLEHVLDPWQAVNEMHRVLKNDGLVYADTPFLQQVHEGPYDFTRFTESGHRYLFRRFAHIESGVAGGPGMQLVWAVDYAARGLFRSTLMGRLFATMFFWLRYLDGLIPAPYAVDQAWAVFFLGRKANCELLPREMVGYYQGAQFRDKR